MEELLLAREHIQSEGAGRARRVARRTFHRKAYDGSSRPISPTSSAKALVPQQQKKKEPKKKTGRCEHTELSHHGAKDQWG